MMDFHWLSYYDYDYAIAAIPIMIFLLFFYRIRRNLPIRQSTAFYYAMIANLVMTIVDILSCELNETFGETPVSILYLINIIYFLFFVFRSWALFDYTSEACREYRILDSRSRFLAATPMLVEIVLILITPWAHTIFRFSENGYENCFLYRSIYICAYFYIFASLILIAACFRKLKTRIGVGLLVSNLVLISGLVLRKVLYGNYLITSYFNTLAVLIIYITSENPDLFRDQRVQLFNRSAFDMIGLDHLYRNEPFHCILVSAHNYETALALYGNNQVIEAIRKAGNEMIRNFPDYYVFYFGSGNFILTKKGKIIDETKNSIEIWHNRFEKMHTIIDDKVTLNMSMLILPFDMMRDNIHKIEDLLQFTFLKTFKENQKGNYTVNDVILNEFNREQEVETALANALKQHTLEAYFQPIYSTAKDDIIGAEALARLIDPKIGYVPPDEFIAIAERNGDIMELGRQIFEKVCEFAQQEHLQERGIEFINVNLSPGQCLNNLLASELSDIARKYDISMNMIDFEITESSAADFRSIQRQMLLLQEEGAELSLDDFGTGTSNLTRLLNLPIHVVKIDMDVAKSYFNNEAPFLPDLIRMFQHADIKIVVEGVETKEMKEALSAMNCDYLQGYYFSKALPPKEFIEYLEKLKS